MQSVSCGRKESHAWPGPGPYTTLLLLTTPAFFVFGAFVSERHTERWMTCIDPLLRMIRCVGLCYGQWGSFYLVLVGLRAWTGGRPKKAPNVSLHQIKEIQGLSSC